MSGVPKEDNMHVFMSIAKKFPWFSPGNPETDRSVLEVIETNNNLLTLKQLYDEKEFHAAFLSRLKQECTTIRNDSKATARKAFVIWISICFADNELSDDERIVLKVLQDYLNTNLKQSENVSLNEAFSQVFGEGEFYKLFQKKQENKTCDSDEEYIPNSFLNEILEILTLLGELKAQIDTTSDCEQKSSLQKSFDIMQQQLNSKIVND